MAGLLHVRLCRKHTAFVTVWGANYQEFLGETCSQRGPLQLTLRTKEEYLHKSPRKQHSGNQGNLQERLCPLEFPNAGCGRVGGPESVYN